MRRAGAVRAVLLAAALVVAAAAVVRLAHPGAEARRPEPSPTAAPAKAIEAAVGSATVPVVRDLFRYLETSPAPGRRATLPPAGRAGEEGTRDEEPPAVRLVGLVRRGGQLRAALSVMGELLVVGPGDRAGSYIVISLDEDVGAILRDAEGALLTLPAPEL